MKFGDQVGGFMKHIKFIILLILAIFLFGCVGQEWDVYTNEKFSVSYPVGTIEKTQGDEIFKVTEGFCEISVTKLTNQPSFDAFVTYIKAFYEDMPEITITSEKIDESSADFEVLADVEDNRYQGVIRMIPCGDNTVYIVLVGCGENWFDKEKADRIIESMQCK